jgi:hypothetical protein
MKRKLIILILLISANTFACECMKFNKETIVEFKEFVDFIFVGTVLNHNNIDNSEYYEHRWNTEKESYEVIVKVEKIIKGKFQSEFVYITQTLSGNCSRMFKKGERYVFSGNHIKEFIDLTPEGLKREPITSTNDSIPEIIIDKTIKPDHDYKNNVIYLTNIEFDFKNWNQLSKEHTLIHTDGCISNTLSSDFGKLLTNE